MKQEEIVRKYFQAWLDKDVEPLKEIFAEDTVYSESDGPEFHGLSQMLEWFPDWNDRGTVQEWLIKGFVHEGNSTVAEWYFKYEYDGEPGEFDGVSLIEFDDEMKIKSLKEFQSQTEHVYPYD